LSNVGKKTDPHRSSKIGEGPAFKNTFNLHDALSKVKDEVTPSVISGIYQNPTLTGGSSVIYSLSGNFDKSKYDVKSGFKLNSSELISIDKIVILFGCPLESYKPFWKAFNMMIDFGRPVIIPANGLYRRSVMWMDDFFIQWDLVQNKIQNIRVEFNPNKANLKPFAVFSSCLKKHSFQTARVSRLDVAVDYAMYLNLLCWNCSNTSVGNTWTNNNIPKTQYFGSRESDIQIRIYDKAYEILKQQKIKLDFDLWRVEAQIKAIKGEAMHLVRDEDISNFNPFERLSFYDQYGFINAGQGVYSLFVDCARAYGISYAASKLNYNTRKKYLQQLKIDMQPLPFHTPAEIYNLYFSKVYIKFLNKLFELFNLGQSQKITC